MLVILGTLIIMLGTLIMLGTIIFVLMNWNFMVSKEMLFAALFN